MLSLVHITSSLTFVYECIATAPTSNDKELEPVQPKDDDPDGLKQLGAADRLEQASKLLHPLSTLAPNDIDVWIATYDVAIRRSKPFSSSFVCFIILNHNLAEKLLQAVAALNRASSLNPDHPELHIRLIDLKQTGEPSLRQQPWKFVDICSVSIFTSAVTSRSDWPGVCRCCIQTSTR